MWCHICMPCPMTAYRCDVTYVQPAQVVCCQTKFVYFCLSNALLYLFLNCTSFIYSWMLCFSTLFKYVYRPDRLASDFYSHTIVCSLSEYVVALKVESFQEFIFSFAKCVWCFIKGGINCSSWKVINVPSLSNFIQILQIKV